MSVYTCPTCGEKMERDLSLFMDHTDRHIIDEVKRLHPKWITEDGYCPKCLDYFKRAMKDQGTVSAAGAREGTNIGPEEIRQRLILGAMGFGASFMAWFWLHEAGAPKIARLALFPLFFAGCLGLFQAQKKLCVVIAQKQHEAMRRRASRILIITAVVSALLTAGSIFLNNRKQPRGKYEESRQPDEKGRQ